MKLALALFVLVSRFASAEVSWRQNLELIPQYRALNQSGFIEGSERYELYGLIASHLEWSRESWFFEIKPEIRSVTSSGVHEAPPFNVTAQTSRRWLNSRRLLKRERDFDAYIDLNRANLRWTAGETEIFAGRRPISLGMLRFFPVWNKLTLPLTFQPGPEWIENPDGFGFATQAGTWAVRSFALRGDEPEDDDLALVEVRKFGQGYEVQLLGGFWWRSSAGGLAASFDVGGDSLRIESLWISRFRDRESQVQTGLGYESALSSKWTLVAEILHQSAGRGEFHNHPGVPNRFMVLAGKLYALPYLTYQLHPLWQIHGGILAGFADEMSYVGLTGFDYNLAENTTLTFKIKTPFGAPLGEFGDRRIEDPRGFHMGMATTAFLNLQSVF